MTAMRRIVRTQDRKDLETWLRSVVSRATTQAAVLIYVMSIEEATVLGEMFWPKNETKVEEENTRRV
jgi:hypothetical protein